MSPECLACVLVDFEVGILLGVIKHIDGCFHRIYSSMPNLLLYILLEDKRTKSRVLVSGMVFFTYSVQPNRQYQCHHTEGRQRDQVVMGSPERSPDYLKQRHDNEAHQNSNTLVGQKLSANLESKVLHEAWSGQGRHCLAQSSN